MDTQQGTPAWFSARKGKLTASNFGAAAGVNPYCSRRKALKLANGSETFTGNEACTWGTKNERNAIKDYMVRTGNVVVSKGFYTHPDHPWIGGSPDGLVGTEGMIEVKCPFYVQRPHERIPVYYYCQVNGLMEILDRQWCDFISWTPTAMRIYRVYRDPDCWAYLLERYSTFYAYMKRGCDKVPNMARGEKQTVLDRIAQSDAHTNYHYWDAMELHDAQCLEGPPDYPFDEESSKQSDSDEPSPVRKLPKCASPTAQSATT